MTFYSNWNILLGSIISSHDTYLTGHTGFVNALPLQPACIVLVQFYSAGHKLHGAFAREKLSHFPTQNSPPTVESSDPVLSFVYWTTSTLF